MTGDLRIVENKKLRKILSKGPNFRTPKTINFSKCLDSIKLALTENIEKYADKHNLQAADFVPWKEKILELVNSKVDVLKATVIPKKTNPILKQPSVIEALKKLHSLYVITPIDKASKNIAFICKKFYINCLMDELGIPGNASPTYSISSLSKNDVISNNEILCRQLIGKELSSDQRDIPVIYWMPKMHYTPSRRRFIIASSNCCTKPLSFLASKIFKHIYH